MSNAISSQWKAQLAMPTQTVTAWAEVWSAPYPHGKLLGMPSLNPGSGSVISDMTSAVRRSATLQSFPQVVDPLGLPIPAKPGDVLFPVGPELHIYKGLIYPGGSRLRNGTIGEAFRIFTGLIETIDVSEGASGALLVGMTARDRSAWVSRCGFLNAFATDGTSPLPVQVMQIVNALPLPAVARDMNWGFFPGPNGFPVPAQATFSTGDDGWQGIVDICAGVGYEALNNVHGDFEVKQPDDPANNPVLMEYAEGKDCTITTLDRTLDITAVPNAIVLTSSGSNVVPPLQATWWDSDPGSPTYYGAAGPPTAPTGDYPTMVTKATTSYAKTQNDADAAVRLLGMQARNTFDTIVLGELHDSARQVEDVVRVTRAKDRVSGLRYTIDALTISLDYATADQMTARRVSWSTIG